MYNLYNDKDDVVLEFRFGNSYYFFAKVDDVKTKKQVLHSFEYIDMDR